MLSRRACIGLSLGSAAGLATGCVKVPQPVSATPPVRPSIDVEVAKGVLKDYVTKYKQAAHEFDSYAMRNIHGAPLQIATVEHVKYAKKYGVVVAPATQFTDPVIYLTAAGAYPRAFAAFEKLKGDLWLLAVHQQASSTSPWLRSFGLAGIFGEAPELYRDQYGFAEVVSPGFKEFGTEVGRIPDQVAAAVRDPKSEAAKQMVATDSFEYTKYLFSEDQSGDTERATLDTSILANSATLALRTTDGVLVMMALEVTQSRTAKPGYHYTKSKDTAEKKGYPAKYTHRAEHTQAQLAVKQTKDGRLHVLDRHYTQVNLTLR